MNEPPHLSIDSILHLYNHPNSTEKIRSLMRQDIASKLECIPPGHKHTEMAIKAILPELPPEYKKIADTTLKDLPETSRRTKYDILVVAVVDAEYDVLKNVFDLEKDPNLDLAFQSYWFHETTIENKVSRKDLSCLFTMVGKSMNVEIAAFLPPIFGKYDIDLAVLVGIAAGPKDKVKFADTIIPPLVFYYESGKIADGKSVYRPCPFRLDAQLEMQVINFVSSHKNDFSNEVLSSVEEMDLGACEYLDQPTLERYVVLSGEKLLADEDEIKKIIAANHDKTGAVEMEGAGFALACGRNRVNWLIFRSISDYGDPDKSLYKPYQKHSVTSAAKACRLFLEDVYIPPCAETL